MEIYDWPQQSLKGKTYAEYLGQRLRYLRRLRLWSQDNLSTRANFAQSTIAEIERGRGNPTLHTLEQLAMALDVHILELLTWRS